MDSSCYLISHRRRSHKTINTPQKQSRARLPCLVISLKKPRAEVVPVTHLIELPVEFCGFVFLVP